MHDSEVARRAQDLGIRSVPAVVIDNESLTPAPYPYIHITNRRAVVSQGMIRL
jgi:hypothetical protein